MTTLSRFLIFSTFLFWCGNVAAGTATVLEIYELRHANIDTVLPVVKNLLEDGETAQGLGQRLIIKAGPESHKQIARFLEKFDIPKPTLAVEVKQIQAGMTNAARAGSFASKSGQLSTHLGNSRNAVTQRILVGDGEDAFVVYGEDIPYASELAMINGRHQGMFRQTDYKKIRTGFRVRPVLQGKTVDVTIIPFRENVRNQTSAPQVDNPPVIDYQEAATRLRVPLNSWFDVGGATSNREQDDLGTVRWSTGRNVQNSSILIRIQLPSSQNPTQ